MKKINEMNKNEKIAELRKLSNSLVDYFKLDEEDYLFGEEIITKELIKYRCYYSSVKSLIEYVESKGK